MSPGCWRSRGRDRKENCCRPCRVLTLRSLSASHLHDADSTGGQMSCRLLFLLVIVTATSLAGSQPVPNVTVHEWGTFTSVAGMDGEAVEWLPLEGQTDLPSFVDRSCFTLKSSLPGT